MTKNIITSVSSQPGHRIAYIMSRFPKITETFILDEMYSLVQRGFHLDIYPLLRQREQVVHPEVTLLQPRVHYHPFLNRRILWANVRMLFARPWRYVRTLMEVLTATLGSWNFFCGALGIFPKTVCMALAMEQSRVEHIHAHFANHPALAALIIHRLTRIPFSFTAHGSDIHVDQTMFARKAQAARFVVTISRYNSEFLARKCGQAVLPKLRVIHCGLDIRAFTPPARRPPRRRLHILCVAAFRVVKGHRYLIEACGLLKQAGIPFTCRLIGAYELEKKIRRQIRRLGLEQEVQLLGPRSRPEVRDAMCQADVVALTSVQTRQGHREGIPMVLMEAMACGCPVVASRISGVPELVEDGRTGLLVPAEDSPAIAAALRRLALNPQLRHQMGRAGRAKIVAEFNRQDSVDRLAALILASVRSPHRATSNLRAYSRSEALLNR